MTQNINYSSIHAIKKLLTRYEFSMQKQFSQNFMIDAYYRTLLSDTLDITHDTDVPVIWEIGPGIGAITTDLLSYTNALYVLEIDHGFIRILHDFFSEPIAKGTMHIISGDALKTWQKLWTQAPPTHIIGNLPYNSASKLIAALIAHATPATQLLFTIQKEVAQRMNAQPQTKLYSAYSVHCQAYTTMRIITHIPPTAFYPQPRVESSLIELYTQQPLTIVHKQFFSELTRCLFASRRKTMLNNFKASRFFHCCNIKDFDYALEHCNAHKGMRAEELSPQQFITLSNSLVSYVSDLYI